MNFRVIAYACFALGALSQGARAADVVYSEPTPSYTYTPAWSWAGGYIGGQLGYGWGTARTDAADANRHGTLLDLKPKGFLGGVYAGYNFDVGRNMILGAEADFIGTGMKDSYSASINNLSLSMERNLQWAGAARLRAGYAIDRFMPYIAGGVAFGKVKNNIGIAHQRGENSLENISTFTGWTIGAGVDYAATDNIILRLEYRYTDYGHKSDDLGRLDITDNLKSNDIRLGVAYKF